MSRANAGTGLEAAPDIMLLTMAALMVAIVWLDLALARDLAAAHRPADERRRRSLGTRGGRQSVHVTLRPGPDRSPSSIP